MRSADSAEHEVQPSRSPGTTDICRAVAARMRARSGFRIAIFKYRPDRDCRRGRHADEIVVSVSVHLPPNPSGFGRGMPCRGAAADAAGYRWAPSWLWLKDVMRGDDSCADEISIALDCGIVLGNTNRWQWTGCSPTSPADTLTLPQLRAGRSGHFEVTYRAACELPWMLSPHRQTPDQPDVAQQSRVVIAVGRSLGGRGRCRRSSAWLSRRRELLNVDEHGHNQSVDGLPSRGGRVAPSGHASNLCRRLRFDSLLVLINTGSETPNGVAKARRLFKAWLVLFAAAACRWRCRLQQPLPRKHLVARLSRGDHRLLRHDVTGQPHVAPHCHNFHFDRIGR